MKLTRYLSATGTAEVGGWTTRELLTILDGLEGLEVIGADVGTYHRIVLWIRRTVDSSIVEVAPIYDNPGETTTLAAAEVVVSLLGLMLQVPAKE